MRDAEVENLGHGAVSRRDLQEDVVRLDVAMDDAVADVDVLERVAHLDRHLERGVDPDPLRGLGDDLRERPPLEPLHHEVGARLLLVRQAAARHGDDMRVIHRRKHLRLALQTLDEIRARLDGPEGLEHLNLLLEEMMTHEIERAMPPFGFEAYHDVLGARNPLTGPILALSGLHRGVHTNHATGPWTTPARRRCAFGLGVPVWSPLPPLSVAAPLETGETLGRREFRG